VIEMCLPLPSIPTHETVPSAELQRTTLPPHRPDRIRAGVHQIYTCA
jgi:hypothetical protein